MIATRSQQALAWGLLVIGLLASGAGAVWNLYSKIFWYDEVVHGYNFFALALVVAVYATEWGYDHFIAKPNVILPKTDTIIDLMVDTAGALLAGFVRLRMLR